MPTATDFDLELAVQRFHALSDATRLDIIRLLSGGERCVCELTDALEKLAHYSFPFELNEVTRTYFENLQKQETGQTAADIKAILAAPPDLTAATRLSAEPAFNSNFRTTCVATRLSGGHANNALPQTAQANVNCRIFPGHPKEEIMAELERVAGEPEVKFSEINPEYVVAAPASPYDADFVRAATKAIEASWGKMPIIASQASGASDSMWYRALGVPSYGASGTFMRDADDFSHGLNERSPLVNVRPAIVYYLTLLRDLGSK